MSVCHGGKVSFLTKQTSFLCLQMCVNVCVFDPCGPCSSHVYLPGVFQSARRQTHTHNKCTYSLSLLNSWLELSYLRGLKHALVSLCAKVIPAFKSLICCRKSIQACPPRITNFGMLQEMICSTSN